MRRREQPGIIQRLRRAGARLWRRFSIAWQIPSWRRVILSVSGVYMALQVATVAVLTVISLRRARRLTHARFPHLVLPEIALGENRLRVFDYGGDLYESMLAAISSAQSRIFIESFIWKSDAVGEEFKRRLLERAQAGVKVYIIIDEFGNLVTPESFKHFPPEIFSLRFRPISQVWHALDPRRYALDHRKILVVDEQVGFIGGFNIGSLYAEHWRDTHLRVAGPGAMDLARAFVDFWNAHAPKDQRITGRFPLRFDPTFSLHDNDALRLTFPIRDMYISAIDRAQRHILLTNAYFIPDHMLLQSLKAAVDRGVETHVLLPWTSNHILADWAARGYFHECLRAGIHIWGYRNAMVHAKTCTIDDEWSTIGTANIDRLSSVGNYELNAEIYSRDLARQMRELFQFDLSNARELTAVGWLKRPWYVKLSEWLLAPLRVML